MPLGACACTASQLIDDAFKREVPRFNGFFHGVSTIIKEEGALGVYQGVAPTIIKVTARTAPSACAHTACARPWPRHSCI